MNQDEAGYMMAKRLVIEPVDGSNFTAATKAALADGHETLAVTDVVKKGGEVVGHISIDGIPTVLVWMDTKKTGSRDALAVMSYFESIAKRTKRPGAAPGILLPCPESSPFFPFLERLGYRASKEKYTLFVKAT